MKKTITTMFCLAISAAAFSQTHFYGGDFDGRNSWTAQTGSLDGRMYDDFEVASQVTVNGLWGNYLNFGVAISSAEWEIRQDVSSGSGGTLVASGTGAPTTTIATGRSGFGVPEWQVSITGLNVVLNPGTYYMALTIENPANQGVIFITSTSGTDLGPGGDPNPGVTGSPIANGNSFFFSNFYNENWTDMEEIGGGSGVWDWSYGVNVVPEPSSIAILSIALGGLIVARRRKR